MSKQGAARQLLGATFGALILLVTTPVVAQQTGNGGSSNTAAKGDQANKSATRKPAKPAANKTVIAADKAKARTEDPWTIDDALLTPRSGKLKDAPEPVKPTFGRLQLDTGTLGIETESKVKDNRFSDGRPVPGLEAYKRNDPTYLGLSLSLPTHNNTILPVPFNPWERRE